MKKKLDKLARKARGLIGDQRVLQMRNRWYELVKKFKTPPYAKVGNFSYIPDFGFFINGWLVDEKNQVTRLDVCINGQPIAELSQCMLRLQRVAIARKYGLCEHSSKPGFTASVPVDGLQLSPTDKASLRISLSTGKKKSIKLRISNVIGDPLDSIKGILNAVPSRSDDKRDLFNHSYGPAISSIWQSKQRNHGVSEFRNYNPDLAPANPEVSLIVPIYGRYDFIEYQLSQFVNDPVMFRQEIIYVIDDPRIHDEVRTVCAAYEKLYRISFKVLHLENNLGYAGANNTGVEHSSAPLLLLVNSDVMPAESGWLSALLDSSRQSINDSLIGVRLLYEDDAIQHDGMEYYSSPFVNELWTNIHPNKGLPSSLVQYPTALRDVESITGACILVKRDIYQDIGGFDENFILGDYEDSDLCMQAREQGYQIKMNSSVSLYHLERQSQSLVSSDNWKNELTYYNCWYHTNKWDSNIKTMKRSTSNAL